MLCWGAAPTVNNIPSSKLGLLISFRAKKAGQLISASTVQSKIPHVVR